MERPVEEGVIKKQTAAFRPALRFSTHHQLTGGGHPQTWNTVNQSVTLPAVTELSISVENSSHQAKMCRFYIPQSWKQPQAQLN